MHRHRFIVRFISDCLPTNLTMHCRNKFYDPACHQCGGIESQTHLLCCPAYQLFWQEQYTKLVHLVNSWPLPLNYKQLLCGYWKLWWCPQPCTTSTNRLPPIAVAFGLHLRSFVADLQHAIQPSPRPVTAHTILAQFTRFLWNSIYTCWIDRCADFTSSSDGPSLHTTRHSQALHYEIQHLNPTTDTSVNSRQLRLQNQLTDLHCRASQSPQPSRPARRARISEPTPPLTYSVTDQVTRSQTRRLQDQPDAVVTLFDPPHVDIDLELPKPTINPINFASV